MEILLEFLKILTLQTILPPKYWGVNMVNQTRIRGLPKLFFGLCLKIVDLKKKVVESSYSSGHWSSCRMKGTP